MQATPAIAFAKLKGISLQRKKNLTDRFGSAEGVLRAVESRSSGTEEESRELALVKRTIDFKDAENEERKLKKLGTFCIGVGDPSYPRLLSEISDPPQLLMGLGILPSDGELFLSVVGPRRPSAYGARVARMLTQDLANEGLVLVSGLARGIDAIAHEASVRANQPTIAVLGCGIDRTYPPEHAQLKAQVQKVGAVITEFFPGDPPLAGHFPQRNRIITGLSRGLLLVEAGEKSGARTSARHAIDQSRDVYAVPGPIDSPLSMFTNRLISEGAKLVGSSADILEDYFPGRTFREKEDEASSEKGDLSAAAQKLLRRLEMDIPSSVEDLAAKESLSVSLVIQSLTELELKGIVAKQTDARYVRLLR